MKYLFAVSLTLLLLGNGPARAQFNHQKKNDRPANVPFRKDLFISLPPLRSGAFQKAVAVPLLLTVAGVYSLTDNDLLNKYDVREERNEWLPKFRHRADDYLQYTPIVAVYGLNLAGVKGKSDLANRTAILIKAELMVGALTFSLKKLTAVPRPDTGQRTSFPSGHTAQAFAAATFMAKEYGYKSVWYSIGAYTIATGIGTMRVMNNRHWVSDVLVGAGIGIFSTNVAYLTHHYRWGKKRKAGQTLVTPSYDGQTALISMTHRFH